MTFKSIAQSSRHSSFSCAALVILLLVIPLLKSFGNNPSAGFGKEKLYSALAGNNLSVINALLNELQPVTIPEKNAYEGALLMKKAGLVVKAKEKLSLFKSGRIKLEAAIKSDEGNAEYRFLRLVIQEHAPKILNYKNDIQSDVELIRSSFKNLAPVVQQAIRDYSKDSRSLKTTVL